MIQDQYIIYRMRAMEWWNNLDGSERVSLAGYYIGRVPSSLTGREIERIWDCMRIKAKV